MVDFKQNADFNTKWCRPRKTVLSTQNNGKHRKTVLLTKTNEKQSLGQKTPFST